MAVDHGIGLLRHHCVAGAFDHHLPYILQVVAERLGRSTRGHHIQRSR